LLDGGALEYNNDFYLAESLYKSCPVKIVMENDAKCAAMAEATVGSLKDVSNGFVLIFGTMIGGAFIKDKRLHKGKHFSSGEVSYINNTRKSLSTFENVWGNRSSVNSLCKMYAKRKNLPIDSVDGILVFENANKKEKQALDCLDDYTKEIAIQIFNLQTILDPERFAIGGGISSQPIFIEYIKKNLDYLYDNCPYNIPKAEVVACKFQNDANLIGAMQCFLSTN
jgi:predicted NBD/HSP70 family sugar kinase